MVDNNSQPVAMITGASSGIGCAIAHRLAQEGYRLALCARRESRLQQLQQELSELTPVLVRPVDLRQEEEILAFFEQVRQQWGGTDVLVNNAGLGYKQSLMDGHTQAWREMLDVNVLAVCICTREAIQDMRRRGRGHIVHISSLSGHRVPSTSGVYAASKFAVRALTEALRQELREANLEIRISSVSPGLTETEFAANYNQSQETAQALYDRFPVLQPEDIADTVAHILQQPAHVQIHDVMVRSIYQSS